MDLDLTHDQETFREMVGDFFERESPITVVRASEPLGFDLHLWRQVAAMGLCAITVPEIFGGGGAGWMDLALVVELAGRSLSPVPLIETAIANIVLASLCPGTDNVLTGAVCGDLLATVALNPAMDHLVTMVPAGAVADVIVALDGDELVAVRDPDFGPTQPRGQLSNLGSMPIANRRLDSGERMVLARGERAVVTHRKALRYWELLTGTALVGLASRALELGLDYVQQREAFGVPVANFQTVQHRLADNATALDGARLLAYEAAWMQDVEAPTAEEFSSMAALFGADVAFKTAADSLQFHGGYGYTLEYDIQLYFRRAKAWPLLAGDPRLRYAELAHRMYDVGRV